MAKISRVLEVINSYTPALLQASLVAALAALSTGAWEPGVWAILGVLSGSLSGFAVMCHQRTILESFAETMDPLRREALIRIQNMLFGVVNGVGLTVVALKGIDGGALTNLGFALSASFNIMLWSQVVNASMDDMGIELMEAN